MKFVAQCKQFYYVRLSVGNKIAILLYVEIWNSALNGASIFISISLHNEYSEYIQFFLIVQAEVAAI